MSHHERVWAVLDQRLGSVRRLHADERGMSLTELLVGTIIGAMIMGVIVSTIFTTTDLRRRAEDRNSFASDLSIASLSFDRDGSMATSGAPARSQTSSTSCSTPIDLGFNEGGASVRYRTTSGALQRVSGAGTRSIVSNVASCSWQTVQVGSGRSTIVITLSLTGASGESLTQSLRVAPRLW
jgi:Tfp pilus assembly protein PilW